MRRKPNKSKRPWRKHPILLKDEDRYRLLDGLYEPPLVKRGFLVDEVRGKVRFATFTNALIPWPKAKREGRFGGGLVLCGGLVRALGRESAPAVCYHWGISHTTVVRWRRALELSGLTAGAQRLVNLGVELARLPQSRKKISEARRGRALTAAHKTQLLGAMRQGWMDRFVARRAEYRRTGKFPKATKSDPWVPEEEKLLAKLTTQELVRVLGRSAKSIQARRILLDIHPAVIRQPWMEWEIRLLGTALDRAIAKRVGRSVQAVQGARQKHGIKGASTARAWTREDEAILGKVSDAEAARRLGRSKGAVQVRRLALGKPCYGVEPVHRWTAAEDAWLGTDTDAKIARRLGLAAESVARRRRKGVAARTKVAPWTAQELAVLGTMSDRAAAQKLNRTLFAVKTKRQECGIPPGMNRRWTPSEDKLLGSMPDEAAARRLGRAVGAARMRRTVLGIPVFESKVRRWEKWELELLGTAPDSVVAKKTGRGEKAVKATRQQLRIRIENEKLGS